jgi:hypothetical protein
MRSEDVPPLPSSSHLPRGALSPSGTRTRLPRYPPPSHSFLAPPSAARRPFSSPSSRVTMSGLPSPYGRRSMRASRTPCPSCLRLSPKAASAIGCGVSFVLFLAWSILLWTGYHSASFFPSFIDVADSVLRRRDQLDQVHHVGNERRRALPCFPFSRLRRPLRFDLHPQFPWRLLR